MLDRCIDSVIRPDQLAEVQRRILGWYASNERVLPWRHTRAPYAILVSEIMLQQTGVARVAPVFELFLERFPTFGALAAAPRVDVLRAWAGLGYNRRAVHLHELAKAVVERHGGELPADPAALRALPGVGPYTQAAIESFIFNRDVAALDTNVRRVIDRLGFGGTGTPRQVHQLAQRLVPSGQGAAWNQALMDFGSLVCVASSPACLLCPLSDLCKAAPVRPGRARRQVREDSETFVGSRRYYRGRAVAVLRELGPEQQLSASELLVRVKPDGTTDDIEWIERLARELADDGLATICAGDDGPRIGPP